MFLLATWKETHRLKFTYLLCFLEYLLYFPFVPRDSISTLLLCAPANSSVSCIPCSLALVSSFLQPALERTILEMKEEEDGMSSLLTPPLPHCCGWAMVLCPKPQFLSGMALSSHMVLSRLWSVIFLCLCSHGGGNCSALPVALRSCYMCCWFP